MSKICLKNIKSQLRDCLPLQRSSRFAYSLGKLGFQTSKMKSRFCIFCLTKIYRRYSNPVSISSDKGIGISVDCVKTRETAPRLIGLKNCAYGLVISRYA